MSTPFALCCEDWILIPQLLAKSAFSNAIASSDELIEAPNDGDFTVPS